MKRIIIGFGIAFLVIIILFVAFGGFAFLNANKLTPSVENFISDFYNQYNQQNFPYIYNSMADEKFKRAGPYDNFEKLMNGIYRKLGKVEAQKKGTWQMNYAPDGVYFSIQCKTTYTKGSSIDYFVLKKHNESWLLVSYNVNSKELLY